MRWTVRFDSPLLVERMRAWVRCYPALARVIPQLLETLATDPDGAGVQGQTFIRDTTAYYFVLTGEEGVPEGLLLTFFVERHEAEHELRVVDGMMGADEFPE